MANKKTETSTKKTGTTVKKETKKTGTPVKKETKKTVEPKKKTTTKTEVKTTSKKVESKKQEPVVRKKSEEKISKKTEQIKVEKKVEKEPKKEVVPKKVESEPPIRSDELMKLVKIVLIVVVIIIIFYGITVLMTKNKKEKTDNNVNNTTPAIIQYDEIMLGTLFRQPRDEYYVLIQKEDDPYNSLFQSYITTYGSKTDSLKVYTANLDSVFNAYYVSEKSNLKTDNISEFRVSDISLIKVKEKAVVESYEGLEEIEKALKELVK